MSPKRGQPPKPPEKKRTHTTVYFSPEEKAEVEKARNIESPEQRFGGYIRDAAVQHSRKVIEKAEKNRKK